jgi:hypothetical protein
MVQSVSTMGCSQSVSSTQTLKFKSILNQQVEAWTTYIAVETERHSGQTLSISYEAET